MPLIGNPRIKLRDLLLIVVIIALMLAALFRTGSGHKPEVMAWRKWVAELARMSRDARASELEARKKGRSDEADALAMKSEWLEGRLFRAKQTLSQVEARCCHSCQLRSWTGW